MSESGHLRKLPSALLCQLPPAEDIARISPALLHLLNRSLIAVGFLASSGCGKGSAAGLLASGETCGSEVGMGKPDVQLLINAWSARRVGRAPGSGSGFCMDISHAGP